MGLLKLVRIYAHWIAAFISRTFNLLWTLWSLRHDSAIMEMTVDEYNNLYSDTSPEIRKKNYQRIVNNFYNISTLFYEWGWGPCFHFSRLNSKENFSENLLKHELELVRKLGLGKGKTCLDVGCGVGGPARNIARTTRSSITGININKMQIERAKEMTQKEQLTDLVNYVEGDFLDMKFNDEAFDAAYAIEATCHAPRREDIFGEVYRVLKPGACFAAYEWCVTDKYDPKNPLHQSIISKIEHGNGLSNTITMAQCLQSLKNVGFEVIEYKDAYEGDKTWWTPLLGNYARPSTFQFTPIGTWVFTKFLVLLEKLKLAPKGTVKISDLLFEAAEGLTKGGINGIYTVGFYFLVQKPKN